MNNKKRIYNDKYNKLLIKYNRDEINFFKSLNNQKKDEIYNIEMEIDTYKPFKEPLRFKFLLMNTSFASPKRSIVGADLNRLSMIMAVLEARYNFIYNNKN